MSLRSLRPTWIALALAASLALASGRAGWRVEYGAEGWTLRAYAEQTVAEMMGVEITAGVEVRLPDGKATPYTAVIYVPDGEQWWIGIEIGEDVPGAAWRAALIGGITW